MNLDQQLLAACEEAYRVLVGYESTDLPDGRAVGGLVKRLRDAIARAVEEHSKANSNAIAASMSDPAMLSGKCEVCGATCRSGDVCSGCRGREEEAIKQIDQERRQEEEEDPERFEGME